MTREEAIQILSTRDAHGVLCGYTSGVTEALDMAIEALQDRLTGEWIVSENGKYITCSSCGLEMFHSDWAYCPLCGADMRGR